MTATSILLRCCRWLLLGGWLATSHASPPTAAADSPPRDFTLVVFSDIHLGAENLKAKEPFTKADTLVRVNSQLDTMRGWVGQAYPQRAALAGLELGKVAPPRGLFVLGDLTDGHKERAMAEEQWRSFEGLFPVEGVSFGSNRVPVFALAGNHDGELAGPQRLGLVSRNRALEKSGRLAALSTNGVHFALNWDGVHFVALGLCPADTTDAETPFKYGLPGPGSWNDPQGALTFLKDYLARHVGTSGDPVMLMQHYGFDGFSLNDWNWWTLKQRRAFYELLKDYNVAAIFHGHNHHAEHYRWPDPKQHAADVAFFFGSMPPENFRQYDVISCGAIAWLVRVQSDHFIAAHFKDIGWSEGRAGLFVKPLKP
jgi:hypothetical protein